MSLEQVLSELRVSMDRLSAALEASLKHPPILITEAVPEKKSSVKTKKVTSPELAPAVPPAQEKAPEVPNATGFPPASTSSDASTPTVPVEDDDFGPAKAPEAVKPIAQEDVRAAAIKCAAVKGEAVAKEIIKTVGNSPNIKTMDASKYPSVMKAFEDAMKG